MKYYNILFSRTRTKDYRWILCPPNLSNRSLVEIEGTMWQERNRDAHNGSYNLFYTDGGIVLARFTKTSYQDNYSRTIWAIDGIYVNHEDGGLGSYVETLVGKDRRCLEGWDLYGFDKMDTMIRNPSPEMYR
jgi:hypothetical protein